MSMMLLELPTVLTGAYLLSFHRQNCQMMCATETRTVCLQGLLTALWTHPIIIPLCLFPNSGSSGGSCNYCLLFQDGLWQQEAAKVLKICTDFLDFEDT